MGDLDGTFMFPCPNLALPSSTEWGSDWTKGTLALIPPIWRPLKTNWDVPDVGDC